MTNGKIYEIAELQLLFRRVDSSSLNFEGFLSDPPGPAFSCVRISIIGRIFPQPLHLHRIQIELNIKANTVEQLSLLPCKDLHNKP